MLLPVGYRAGELKIVIKIKIYIVIINIQTLFNFRHGPARYRFQSMYDLCNLAVVNIKDIKNSFKLLAFPETRVFQTPNTGQKVNDNYKFIKCNKYILTLKLFIE